MSEYLWSFPSVIPEVNEDMNQSPMDLGWGDFEDSKNEKETTLSQEVS